MFPYSTPRCRFAFSHPLNPFPLRPQIRNVMEENQQKLAERGEKLSRLQDKAGDLSETAAGFAEMAKLLAEREKQKTRWF